MKNTTTIIFSILLLSITSCFVIDVSDEYFFVNLKIDGETWDINSNTGTFDCQQNWLWDFDWNCDWRSDNYLLKLEFTCYQVYGYEADPRYDTCYVKFTNKKNGVTEVYFSEHPFLDLFTSWDSGNITKGTLDGALESYLKNDPDEGIPVNMSGKFKIPHDTNY